MRQYLVYQVMRATTSSLSSYLTTATATSTYATISSLSAYVKSSLANTVSALQTFSNGISVTGGIGVPSATMTAPAVNQIGYTTSVTSATAQTTGRYTYGSLTLSPVGSVWIVNAFLSLTYPNAMHFLY